MAIRVHCCTWNVNAVDPPLEDDLRPLFSISSKDETDFPDVVAVCLQEVSAKPQTLLAEYIRENAWIRLVQDYLGLHGLVKLKSLRMLGNVIVVSVKASHLSEVRNIQTGYYKTAFGGWVGTKGAVGVRFDLYGESLCFINTHLSAYFEEVVQRNSDYQNIVQNLQFSVQPTPLNVLEHDYVFWSGDLNYRISHLTIDNIKGLVGAGNYDKLWEYDQLIQCKGWNQCFVGFKEGQLFFPPSYKYKNGTDLWDDSSEKNRKPAWTDRILWREAPSKEGKVEQLNYSCHMQYKISDHKPISSTFSIDMKESMQNITEKIIFRLDLSAVPWQGNEDGLLVYVVKEYKTYSWDWIGLYRLGWRYFTDYEQYEWAVGDADEYGENGAAVLFDCLPDEPGFYQFGYFSYYLQGFVGVSEPFEILPPRDEDTDPVEVSVADPIEDENAEAV